MIILILIILEEKIQSIKTLKKVLPSHYLKINIDTFKCEEICYWEKKKKINQTQKLV